MPLNPVGTWTQGMGASSLGVFFVVCVALGGLGGVWLDGHFHKSPLFALLGVFLGLGAGIREMLKTLKETSPTAVGRAVTGNAMPGHSSVAQKDSEASTNDSGGSETREEDDD